MNTAMPNNLFLPSNEPAQAAMRNITATRASNALTQQTQLENQALQQNMQHRMELETVLRTSENPDRAGYEWAKRNDPKLYMDLSKFYLERFVAKLDMDENAAQKELENATGETMLIGERYIAPFKDAAGNPDPAQGLIDKITKRFFQPERADQLAHAREDFERRKQAEEHEYQTGKQIEQQVFQAAENEKLRKSQEKVAGINAAARVAPKTYGPTLPRTIYDDSGKVLGTYWFDPISRTLSPVELPGGQGEVPKGSALTEPKGLGGQAQSIIQNADVSLETINRLEKTVNKLQTGPLRGRGAEFSLRWLGGMGLGGEEIQIRQDMGRLSADQIFGEGGKQLTQTEKQMIGPYVLQQSDELPTILAKLPQLKLRIQQIRQSRFATQPHRTQEVMRDIAEPGSTIPGGAGAPPAAASPAAAPKILKIERVQ